MQSKKLKKLNGLITKLTRAAAKNIQTDRQFSGSLQTELEIAPLLADYKQRGIDSNQD